MVDLTPQKLALLIPSNKEADSWCELLNKHLPEHYVDTVERVASFIAQCAHESREFTRLTEDLRYRASALQAIWPSRFDEKTAEQYQFKQEMIANRAYANKLGNGSEATGDGWRYRGRGLIQLTGKVNYKGFADSLGITLEEAVSLAQTKDGAVQCACYFWTRENLNQFADSGDIIAQTRRINAKLLGLKERQARYNHAVRVLGD